MLPRCTINLMPSKLDPVMEQQIVDAYLAGATMAEASQPFGCTSKACFNALRRRGIAPRARNESTTTPEAVRQEAVRRYLAGESAVKIAAAMGLTSASIYNFLRREDIERRSAACKYRLSG